MYLYLLKENYSLRVDDGRIMEFIFLFGNNFNKNLEERLLKN